MDWRSFDRSGILGSPRLAGLLEGSWSIGSSAKMFYVAYSLPRLVFHRMCFPFTFTTLYDYPHFLNGFSP